MSASRVLGMLFGYCWYEAIKQSCEKYDSRNSEKVNDNWR